MPRLGPRNPISTAAGNDAFQSLARWIQRLWKRCSKGDKSTFPSEPVPGDYHFVFQGASDRS